MNEPRPLGIQPEAQQSVHSGPLSRREFLRLVTLLGTSYAAAQALAACAPPVGSPSTMNGTSGGLETRSVRLPRVASGMEKSAAELMSIPSGDGVVANRRTFDGGEGYEVSPIEKKQEIEAVMDYQLPWHKEVETPDELRPIFFKNGGKNLPWLTQAGAGAFAMAVGLSQYKRILESHVNSGEAEDVKMCANGEKKTIDHNWNLALYVMAVATGVAGVSGLNAEVVKVLSERMNGFDYNADILMIRVNIVSLVQELGRKGMTMDGLGIGDLPKIGNDIFMRVILPAKQAVDPIKGPWPTVHWVSYAEKLEEVMGRESGVIDKVKDPLGYFARIATLAKLAKKYIRDNARTWCNPFFKKPKDVNKMMIFEIPGAIDIDDPNGQGLGDPLLGVTPTPNLDGFRRFSLFDPVEQTTNFILVPQ